MSTKPKSRDRSSRRIVAKGQAGCRSVDPGPEQYAARWRIDRRRLVAWVPPVAAGFNVPLDAATGVIGRPSSSFPFFFALKRRETGWHLLIGAVR